MNHIFTIARKELRAYFLSPIALIFLGTFLLATLFTFFWVDTFFARNIADIRPLFKWLPILLIFLGAAITMRLWSEEQKLGTLEILKTLPVATPHLVVGKFLAAFGLVVVALFLTLGVPITVSMMGDLDWGPIFGGYLGALLLAGAYLSIGLCVSAMTDNQIISLILTCLICGLLYMIGTEHVTDFVGSRTAEVLTAIGTGSRFESIGRGVVDLRDLVYYFSLIITFLAINTVLLEAKGWSSGVNTAENRRGWTLMVGLVAANALVLNILLGPVQAIRVDLTKNGEYSISNVTKEMIRGLDEPLLIRGYFSGKTHPLLAPLVPRIRDVIEEYGVVAHGKVITEYVDPREDEELEKEAHQLYGIKPQPFRIRDRHDKSVVNSYFSILVKYGDEFEVLGFNQLIEVQATDMTNIEVKLRNLEYDLTRTIKKVAYGFQTIDAVFANLDGKAEFTAYITPGALPENFKDVPKYVKGVLEEIKKDASGKFEYRIIDPDKDQKETRQFIFKRYGFKPFAVSLLSQETFYLHLLLKVGEKYQRVFPGESMSEADIKKEITAALQRAAPGFLKTVGLVIPEQEQPKVPPQFRQQQPPPLPDLTQMLRRQLGQTYTVKDVDLKDGRISGDVDVLVIFAPKDYDEKKQFAVDQFLMRGGSVLVLGGSYELDLRSRGGFKVNKVKTGLEDILASYGITVQEKLVLDEQNEPIPVPTNREIAPGLNVREIQFLPYPFFVDIRSTGMDAKNPVVGGLPSVTMPWVSPISVSTQPEKKEGEDALPREVTTLLKSSEKSWTSADTNVQPDMQRYPKLGFEAGTNKDVEDLAIAVTGGFESFFKDKKDPTNAGQVIKRSPNDARLVVVGTSSFVNDAVLQNSASSGGDRHTNNLRFLQNLVDWGVEDTDLLTIRSGGTFARTLLPMEPKDRATYEAANYIIVVVALVLIIVYTADRRRRLKRNPIALLPASGKSPKTGKTEAEAES